MSTLRRVDPDEVLRLCTFVVGQELFAIDIMRIREIVRPLPVTPVPKSPFGMLGVIDLRGAVLPVFELRLPTPTVVSLIIRRGRAVVPDRETVLARGDELVIVTTTSVRDATERRLRAVSRRGRLARWFGERGDPVPS